MKTKVLSYESEIKTLLGLLELKSYRKIHDFKYHPVLKIHEIAFAVYLCALMEEGSLSQEELLINTTVKGTIKLLERACFLWGGLPYPAEHAELGLLLLRLSEYGDSYTELIEKMGVYQQAILNHRNEVMSSIYRQGKGRNLQEIDDICRLFLHRLNIPFSECYSFLDEELGFWMTRSLNFTAFISGSGCKSGMGAFLYQDVGVINFGPQFTLPEDTSRFGIAGQVKDFHIYNPFDSIENGTGEITLSYGFSPAYSASRLSGFSFLEDSGDFGGRFYAQTVVSKKLYQATILAKDVSERFVFSVFCSGSLCRIEGGPTLRASSLDSYKGPTEIIALYGTEHQMLIECPGSTDMEIFSLPGDESFWGADFIIIFRNLNNPFDLIFRN